MKQKKASKFRTLMTEGFHISTQPEQSPKDEGCARRGGQGTQWTQGRQETQHTQERQETGRTGDTWETGKTGETEETGLTRLTVMTGPNVF